MHSVALTLGNIGILYHNRAEYSRVLEYLEKSLAIQKEIGFDQDIE